MNHKAVMVVLFLAAIASGLLAGFFYTWSFTIVHSLDLIDEQVAANAMVSINANIRSGWFAAIFFGAPVLILASLIVCVLVKKTAAAGWLCIALAGAVSTLVITFQVHLPLNDQLANGANWSNYSSAWVEWNHARMVTSLIAFLSVLSVSYREFLRRS